MLQIVLIRPGATDYDQQGRIQGVLDVPLSNDGASEVTRVGEELAGLGVEVVYSSACARAIQTASRVAEILGVKFKKLDNMQNLDHGLWQGMLVEDVRRKQPKVYRQWQEQPESICPPEGEMLGEARERVAAALGKVIKKHKQGVIGLVAPEPLASLVRCHLDHSKMGDLWEAETEHGTWEVVEVRLNGASQAVSRGVTG